MLVQVTCPKGGNFEDFFTEFRGNPILQQYELAIVPENQLYDREKIKELLFEDGQTSILKKGPLNEEIVVKGAAQNAIIGIVQKYLDKIFPDQELIIVDPYFFSEKLSARLQFICN
jgi:hypothetical protein